jgi:hypothetical protein
MQCPPFKLLSVWFTDQRPIPIEPILKILTSRSFDHIFHLNLNPQSPPFNSIHYIGDRIDIQSPKLKVFSTNGLTPIDSYIRHHIYNRWSKFAPLGANFGIENTQSDDLNCTELNV